MNQINEIDLSRIIKTLKKGKKGIAYTTFFGILFSILYLFMATPYYESYISINPIGENSNSSSSFRGLKGLSSEYGVNVNLGDFIDEKPSFYIPDIVNSRMLKKAVINNNWKTIDNESINLISYWEIDDTTYMDIAIEKLTRQILVQEEQSGLIVISVLMEEPQLAADIANYTADYIKKYVSDIVLSHTFKHRKFIEERLSYSKQELSKSEEELKEFSEKNPFAIDSPELQLQRGRLMRNMEVNQQVYITLRQQYEMARINELKEIPVINILDYGEASSEETKPRKILTIFLSIILSVIFSSSFLIIKQEIHHSH